jgi:hypothetical protein
MPTLPETPAASIGPMVCELDGPIPILKISKRLVFTARAILANQIASHKMVRKAAGMDIPLYMLRMPTTPLYRRQSSCLFGLPSGLVRYG